MKTHIFGLIGLLAVLTLAACVSSKPAAGVAGATDTIETGASMEAPEVLVVLQGSQGKQEEPMIVIAHDQASFASLWRQINGVSVPVPELDFSVRVVVGVFMGQRSTGGYSLSMGTASWLADGRLGIQVLEQSPKPGSMVTQALTSPFIILNAPKGELDPLVELLSK